ncbi:MAG: hypothetical protein EAX90_14970 [Candidatus Heimdallarchaeota archaeon]|nr:hypothetical protein [Candidatus Heimdallarchaeota archaeon]
MSTKSIIFKKKKNQIFPILIIGLILIFLLPSTSLKPVKCVTKEEAFTALTEAFEKIKEASIEGVDVSDFVLRINYALKDYNLGFFDDSYNESIAILEEVSEILANIRWGKIFPYIIIPINIVLVAAIIVFFGRNIWGWFKKKADQEFLDLEIIYEDESGLELSEQEI